MIYTSRKVISHWHKKDRKNNTIEAVPSIKLQNECFYLKIYLLPKQAVSKHPALVSLYQPKRAKEDDKSESVTDATMVMHGNR